MRRMILVCALLTACSADNSGTGQRTMMDPVTGGQTGGSMGSLEDGAIPPAQNIPDSGVPNLPDATSATDYRMPGSANVSSQKQMFMGDVCSFEAETFTPDKVRSDVNVIIAPGFALAQGLGSTREALTPLAQHLASFGVVTHTVRLCTNGQSIDHPRNGAAIAEFGQKQGGSKVLYAGFSAGGLASMIAAAQATNTIAYFGLDAVDSGELAKSALDQIDEPVYALLGEPSSCNSDSNMKKQYEGRKARVVKVNGAQHFIFEGASCQGIKCALCNGGGEPEATAVRAMMAAFVMKTAAIDPNALRYWQEGSAEWKSLGVLSNVQ